MGNSGASFRWYIVASGSYWHTELGILCATAARIMSNLWARKKTTEEKWWAIYEQPVIFFFQKILNFSPRGLQPPGPPGTRLERPLKKRTRLGRPLKKRIFQTWPRNLYNQAAQVESFNFIPISSKMVQVMMVYERSGKTSQKTFFSNLASKPI